MISDVRSLQLYRSIYLFSEQLLASRILLCSHNVASYHVHSNRSKSPQRRTVDRRCPFLLLDQTISSPRSHRLFFLHILTLCCRRRRHTSALPALHLNPDSPEVIVVKLRSDRYPHASRRSGSGLSGRTDLRIYPNRHQSGRNLKQATPDVDDGCSW